MIESALRWATLGVLAILPIAGPTDMVWAHAMLAGVLMLLAATGMISGRLNPDFTPPLIQLLAGFAFLCFLQMIPLPHEVLRFISPVAFAWGDSGEWGTATVDIGATQLVMVKLLGAASVILMLQSRLFRGERKFQVLQVIAFSAGIQAVIGGYSLLSGEQWGPYLQEKVRGLSYATGTFVYHNHFAAFMNLGAFACLLLLSNHDRKGNDDASQLLRKIAYRLLLAVIVIGLTLSRSRGGALSFTIMIGGYSIFLISMFIWKGKGGARGLAGPILLIFSVLLVDLLVVSHWFGFAELAERFATTNLRSEIRDDIAYDLVDNLRPARLGLLGVGGGAFEVAFVALKDNIYYRHFRYAHNDVLEVYFTFGLMGGAALLFQLCRQLLNINKSLTIRWSVLLLLFSSAHALLDFPFASYPNLVYLVVLFHISGKFRSKSSWL